MTLQKPGSRPETIDTITLAYYRQILDKAKLKPRDTTIEVLMGNYETMLRVLESRLRPDRAQLLLVAGTVAAGVVGMQPDDHEIARRSVSIAQSIVHVVDEVER